MILTAALIEKLICLSNGEILPSGKLKGECFEQMRSDGILLPVTHGSRKSFRVADVSSFRDYLESKFDIRDLESTLDLLLQESSGRAEQVSVTGNSKFQKQRSFYGFLVNSCEPIIATLNGGNITIFPPDGSFFFVADYEQFSIPDDIVVVGIENCENFRHIKQQLYLFDQQLNRGNRLLFVSRYPQNGDLVRWLSIIPNPYIHFGDLDLAGVAIFQNEFQQYLGNRATFLIPNDYELRISNGSTIRYNDQFAKYGKITSDNPQLSELIAAIHRYHRGYDQEGFIKYTK